MDRAGGFYRPGPWLVTSLVEISDCLASKARQSKRAFELEELDNRSESRCHLSVLLLLEHSLFYQNKNMMVNDY